MVVYDGRRLRDDEGTELLYYHWGRMRHRDVRWPDAEEARHGFAFDRYGFYEPGAGTSPAGGAPRRWPGPRVRHRYEAAPERREGSPSRQGVGATDAAGLKFKVKR